MGAGPGSIETLPRHGYCKLCIEKQKNMNRTGVPRKPVRKRLFFDQIFKTWWCEPCMRTLYRNAKKKKKRLGLSKELMPR